ncbi:POK19 protein, partial [Rhinoptilus africanus]|nr:POK19 protein [Rhinoptilus africanus]
IVDLKDCFFTIPLHPDDAEKFAFTVPSVNKSEPAKRYYWVVLPQGMKNSPTLCQTSVAWVLQPFKEQNPFLLVYHYMDDILVAGENLNVETTLQELQVSLES